LGINLRYPNYPNDPVNRSLMFNPTFSRTAPDPAPQRSSRTTSYSTCCSCKCPDFTLLNSDLRIGGCDLNGISVNSLMCHVTANANCVCTDMPLCPVRASANANCLYTDVLLYPVRVKSVLFCICLANANYTPCRCKQ
jgi:hypothetical protein